MMNENIVGHVENTTKLSRRAQLESYDGCARLRPVWDEIASKYDVILTPSVVDEAPVGIASTGDAVRCSPLLPSGSTDRTSRVSARCGPFSKFHVSMCPASLDRMVCQSDLRWSGLGIRISMCYMLERRSGSSSSRKAASSRNYSRMGTQVTSSSAMK